MDSKNHSPDSNLIDSLVEDLEPTPPLKSPSSRWLLWFAVSFSSVTALMLIVQSFRPGFFTHLAMPLFLLETVLAFGSAASCAYLAHLMVMPCRTVTKKHYLLFLSPFALFVCTLLYGAFFSPPLKPSSFYRGSCLWEIILFSWIPLLFLSYQLRKAYPFFYSRTGFLIGLASSALPVALMQFACMHDPRHTLRYHLLPALGVTLVSVAFARFLLAPHRNSKKK